MVFPQKLNIEMQALSGKNKAKSPIKIYVTNRINIYFTANTIFNKNSYCFSIAYWLLGVEKIVGKSTGDVPCFIIE